MALAVRVQPEDADDDAATTAAAAAAEFLVDVGFAGTNSIAPCRLGTRAPQTLPEGQFRVVDGVDHIGLPQPPRRRGRGVGGSGSGGGGGGGGGEYTALQMLKRGEWTCLYVFRSAETAIDPDLEMSNWISCTGPSSRFTSQFFCSIMVGDERHHILNEKYVVRRPVDGGGGAGGGEEEAAAAVRYSVETTDIVSAAQLVELLSSVFGLVLSSGGEAGAVCPEGLDRYL
jgi:arylamine N-acetyltransferase